MPPTTQRLLSAPQIQPPTKHDVTSTTPRCGGLRCSTDPKVARPWLWLGRARSGRRSGEDVRTRMSQSQSSRSAVCVCVCVVPESWFAARVCIRTGADNEGSEDFGFGPTTASASPSRRSTGTCTSASERPIFIHVQYIQSCMGCMQHVDLRHETAGPEVWRVSITSSMMNSTRPCV